MRTNVLHFFWILKPGDLSRQQILFGGEPLRRELPLSGDGMAMDAKEFFAPQETTAREIRQQLDKKHAVRAKTAPKSTAQKFRVGDPVWVLRPQPVGTHCTKTWFTPKTVMDGIGEDTYRITVGPGSSGSDMKVNCVPVSLTSLGSIRP